MKAALKILLWLLLAAAIVAGVLAGIPFAVEEIRYAQRKNEQVAQSVQSAERFLVDTLRSDAAITRQLGAFQSLSGTGHTRHKSFVSLIVEFERTAQFERGTVQVRVSMSRKYDNWPCTPEAFHWDHATTPTGAHVLNATL